MVNVFSFSFFTKLAFKWTLFFLKEYHSFSGKFCCMRCFCYLTVLTDLIICQDLDYISRIYSNNNRFASPLIVWTFDKRAPLRSHAVRDGRFDVEKVGVGGGGERDPWEVISIILHKILGFLH